MAFSPNGKLLATGGCGNVHNGERFTYDVHVWDTATLKTAHILHGHTSEVQALAFSPDGKSFASGGKDMTVRLWDFSVRPPVLRATLPGGNPEVHTTTLRYVMAVAFSPDSRTLAVGDQDGTVRLWDLKPRQPREAARIQLPYKADLVTSLAFSPDGQSLAVGIQTARVRVFDRDGGRLRERAAFEEKHGYAYSVAFAPEGRTLAYSYLNKVKLWDLSETPPKLLRTLEGKVEGKKPAPEVWRMALSPKGDRVATSTWEGVFYWWDVAGRRSGVVRLPSRGQRVGLRPGRSARGREHVSRRLPRHHPPAGGSAGTRKVSRHARR